MKNEFRIAFRAQSMVRDGNDRSEDLCFVLI